MVIARLGRGKNEKYKEIMEMLNILFNIRPQSGLSNKEERILKEINIEEIKGEVDNMYSLSQGILEEGIEQDLREEKAAKMDKKTFLKLKEKYEPVQTK